MLTVHSATTATIMVLFAVTAAILGLGLRRFRPGPATPGGPGHASMSMTREVAWTACAALLLFGLFVAVR